jgi:hypothetical protein
MLDFLESLEPYTSYRFALGLVLTGMTLYWVITSLGGVRTLRAFIRDLNTQVNDERMLNDVRLDLDPDFDVTTLPRLNAKPGRIIKLELLTVSVRMMSWRTLRRVWLELLGCAVLLPAAVYAYWVVFSAEL